MAQFNAVNRGVYIANNLDFLGSLNSECIDLVCIDPPFAKNETFRGDRLRPKLTDLEKSNEMRLLQRWGIADKDAATKAGLVWPDGDPARGRRNAKGGYTDIWSWEEDITEDWMLELADRPHLSGIHKLIDATRYVHGDSVAAYLCYMAVRIIEIRRVLKPTGSLFLHCDHTANGYLRQLLDAVFGNGENNEPGFRNEIVWDYGKVANSNAKRFLRAHDTIYFYSKGRNPLYNRLFEESLSPRKQQLVETGYNTKNMNGLRYIYIYDQEKVDARVAAGRLDLSRFDVIRTVDTTVGNAITDVFAIDHLNSQSKQTTGYPTQKPYELAERIIKATTKPGDIVLDCFAGCAYAAVAAEMLGKDNPGQARQWVACDNNLRAWTVFKRQFNKEELVVLKCNDETSGQQVMGSEPTVTVHGPRELPQRVSPVTDDWQTASKLGQVKPTPNYKEKAKDVFDDGQMRKRLLKLSGYLAWCCGFANRRPDGSVIETTDNFHLDHIRPKSKGGTDRIYNRAPMCLRHNTSKGNREISLERLRTEIAAKGELQVPLDDLIDLDWAYDRAMEIWAIEFAGQHAPAPTPA